MENLFVRTRSTKDILICGISIIGGCVLMLLPAGSAVHITGFFLLFAGLILLLVLKTGYRHLESGVKYLKAERYFPHDMHDEIKKKIASPEKISAEAEDKGSSLRLDVYYSRNAGNVYTQLYEYVPYKYEPCSKIYEHTFEEGFKLIEK